MQLLLLITLFCSICSCCEALVESEGRQDSYIIRHTKEGEDIHLKYMYKIPFPFNGEGCSYDLNYNDKTFHSSGFSQNSDNYPSTKHIRSFVQREDLFGYIVISFTIKSITFEDYGKYSCNFFCGASKFSNETYNITVSKVPGKADCDWHEEAKFKQTHSVLKCHARNLYPYGGIICFVSDHTGITAYQPFHVEGTDPLIGKFLLSRNAEVTCCSTGEEDTKSFQTCKDFHSNTLLPSSTEAPIKTATQIINKDYITNITIYRNVSSTNITLYKDQRDKRLLIKIILPIIAVIIIIIVMIVYLRIHQAKKDHHPQVHFTKV